MTEKVQRNDPCPCGSKKKYKKCCGISKKLTTRKASVIDASSSLSLLDRIKYGSESSETNEGKGSSLKDRISKDITTNDTKNSD